MKKNIITNSIVDMIAVTDCQVHAKVGEHGFAIIKGIIADADEKKVIRAASGSEYASIEVETDDKKGTLFAGIVISADVSNETGARVATIKLGGATMLMENEIRTRTFQNSSMTYDSLISTVNSAYDNIEVKQNVASGSSLGKLIAQYKEDDWTFVTRLASIHKQPVITRYKNKGIHYDFGLDKSAKAHELKALSYSKGTCKKELEGKLQNLNFITVSTRDLYHVADKISFDGQQMFVFQADCVFDEAELIYTYVLRNPEGFEKDTLYNWGLTGASLNAKIIGTNQDTVKVAVDVDGSQDESTAKWFPFSTVYSSPDGTGWYCMPEKGDSVRLYFPDEIEDNGYIISAIHSGDAGSKNPDDKSISNKYNKQLQLSPTNMFMTNNNGMSITIDDNEGISIISDKKITIKSDDEISILSENAAINVNATEKIVLSQMDAKITMAENVTIEGAKVYMQ